ncbi:murein hydrolase activator EnvC family protein [Bacillus thermotolerans]|uniref:murein hydrolase activator EnvC family protein n=1 Tax=Bacillus thermotolerans TaxID=1221996 RepID=UPI000589559E|nr:peptidoglycan DD-metalloendopeptidase family protein [Bacillus thermotolerans]KKB43998.1 peptidoglycan lytic protein P45 [Bacillus thermotolerans]
MKKRIGVTTALAMSLGFGSVFGGADEASASKLSDLENRQYKIESEHSTIKDKIEEKKQTITELRNQQERISAEIKKLDQSITKTEKQIREKQKEIADTKAEIEELKKKIAELEKRIEERNVVLAERARTIQENGSSASYIDVLLGAKSFSDFISRANAVTTLVNADKEILEQQEKDKAELEASEKKLKEKLSSLESMLADLEKMKEGLNKKKAEKNEVMQQLATEEDKAHNQKLGLEEEQQLLASQKSSIQQAIASEKERIKKEEEARKERERLAREQAQKEREQAAAREKESQAQASAAAEAPAKEETKVASASRSSDTPAVSSGMFMRPAEGHLSSGFGHRSLGNHKGIDIANSVSVPIVAAADGVVSRSYYSSSYGNAIFISHSINGKVYTTVYAHMSERVVQSGEVSKGQVIGYMGNTGRSYGQHLHFEIHEGPWTQSKENAVDPAKYINF